MRTLTLSHSLGRKCQQTQSALQQQQSLDRVTTEICCGFSLLPSNEQQHVFIGRKNDNYVPMNSTIRARCSRISLKHTRPPPQRRCPGTTKHVYICIQSCCEQLRRRERAGNVVKRSSSSSITSTSSRAFSMLRVPFPDSQ